MREWCDDVDVEWRREGRMMSMCDLSSFVLYESVPRCVFYVCKFCVFIARSRQNFWPRGAERHRPTCTPGLGG